MSTETIMDSPLGPLRLRSSDTALMGIYFPLHKSAPPAQQESDSENAILRSAREQLQAYFQGSCQYFDLPLEAHGTDFQRRVWAALNDIEFGQTTSYGELARRLDCPGGARAVGHAVGMNPLSIVVPCHRVVASNGQLTGYAGGLSNKRWLLQHESSSPVYSSGNTSER